VPLTSLINDYKWFMNCDKVPAVNSFLKIEAPKESMESLIKYILNSEEESYKFIDSITARPRNHRDLYKNILDKLSPSTSFYCDYDKAYEKYLDKKVHDAGSITELLRIRPDWKGDVLLNKHRGVYHNDNFEIGQIPESIGKEEFPALLDYLKGFMTIGDKYHTEIPEYRINNKVFKIEKNIDGKSDKNIFKITDRNSRSYIIKMANPADKGFEDPFCMGATCLIDSYLTENLCRNSAPLRYYNHNNNISVYEYINPVKVNKIQTSNHDIARKMPDMTALGMIQNDMVGANNYFKLDNTQNAMKKCRDFDYGVANGEYISVDNDHATYGSPLSPVIKKYNQYLPNGMLGMFF